MNVPGRKYVNVPTNNIISLCPSSRKKIFIWGAVVKQRKMSDIRSRNSRTNNFQNGRPEFETDMNLSKKESVEAMPPHA